MLDAIRSYDVANYTETLQLTHSAPGVKQQLAALRSKRPVCGVQAERRELQRMLSALGPAI